MRLSSLLTLSKCCLAAAAILQLASCAQFSSDKSLPMMESELVVADEVAGSESVDAVELEGAAASPASYLYSEVAGVATTSSRRADQDYQLELGGLNSSIEAPQNPANRDEATLPLSGALAEVWANHPNVVRALSEVEASGYDLSGAKTGYYPYLSLAATEASNDASSTSLNVIQPLWSGGRTSAQVQEAEATKNKALATLNQTRLNLALEVADSYLNVVQAEEQGRLWKRYIASLNELLRVIENRSKSGMSPPVDIQTAQTRLSQARAGLAASRTLLISNRLHLAALVHKPIPQLYWPGEAYRLSQEDVSRILAEKAIGSHPSGQVALAEIAVQRARVKLAKAGLFPQLSLQYSKQLDQSSGDFTPDSSTRLVLEYDSGDGLRGFTGYKAVQQRLNAAQQDLAYAQRDIRDIIYTAKSEREVAESQFDAQVDAAQAAVKLVGSFLRQFKVGRKAWIEVLNAHREAHEALLQISAIKRNFWSANVRLALQGMLWVRVSEDAPSTYLKLEN
jgi:outer membrane protein, adhesin transport system